MWMAGLPTAIRSEPSGFRASAKSCGKSEYSMIEQLAVDQDEIAELVVRPLFRDDFARNVGLGRDVPAEKDRIGDFHERVIDLEIEDVPHADMMQPIEQAAVGHRRERAAVTVRTREQSARRFEQQPPGRDIERRHRALAEERHVFRIEAEVMVLLEVLLGLGVRGVAGHHQKRNPDAVLAAAGQHLLRMQLKEALPGNRPDVEHPLRMIEPEPAALPAGHEHDRDFAYWPAPGRPSVGRSHPPTSGSTLGSGCDAVGRRHRKRSVALGVELLEQIEIERLQLPDEMRPLFGPERVPAV